MGRAGLVTTSACGKLCHLGLLGIHHLKVTHLKHFETTTKKETTISYKTRVFNETAVHNVYLPMSLFALISLLCILPSSPFFVSLFSSVLSSLCHSPFFLFLSLSLSLLLYITLPLLPLLFFFSITFFLFVCFCF